MRISVKVKLKAKEPKVSRLSESHYEVSIRELPVDGKANAAVIEVLADYFNASKSQVRIVSGHTSRNKVINIG